MFPPKKTSSIDTVYTTLDGLSELNPGFISVTYDAGIAYAVDQIVDLVSNEVRGIHLYTMNNPMIAKRICDNIAGLRSL